MAVGRCVAPRVDFSPLIARAFRKQLMAHLLRTGMAIALYIPRATLSDIKGGLPV